jgi:hypothetical protein
LLSPDEPVGLRGRRLQRPPQPDRGAAVEQCELQLGLHDRQWGAQLVTRVGDEPAFGLQCGALGRPGAPDAVEHRVEGRAESAELVVDGWRGQPGVVGVSDRLRSAAHRLDGAQRQAGDQVPDGGGGHQSEPQPGDLEHEQCGERLGALIAGGRHRDDDRLVAARHRHGEDAQRLVQRGITRPLDDDRAAQRGAQLVVAE